MSAQLCSNICQILCVDLWSFVVRFHAVLEGGEVLPSQEDHVVCICNLFVNGILWACLLPSIVMWFLTKLLQVSELPKFSSRVSVSVSLHIQFIFYNFVRWKLLTLQV